jgi:hypothetical protein
MLFVVGGAAAGVGADCCRSYAATDRASAGASARARLRCCSVAESAHNSRRVWMTGRLLARMVSSAATPAATTAPTVTAAR